MCTVTIIPQGNNDFILTSNRDEAPNRVSLVPDFFYVNNTKLLYPEDVLSGGTWIGTSEKNRLVCVLNGGFELHKRKPSYRKSRGVVAKDFMIAEAIIDTIKIYNLEGIEPFTMVIVDWNTHLKFYELVWDGVEKYITELPLEPRIWSSSTLYNRSMREERNLWFEDYKVTNALNANTIKTFHKTAGANNQDYGVVMNRGVVKTTSITQVEKRGDAIEMRYESLQDNLVSIKPFKTSLIINE